MLVLYVAKPFGWSLGGALETIERLAGLGAEDWMFFPAILAHFAYNIAKPFCRPLGRAAGTIERLFGLFAIAWLSFLAVKAHRFLFLLFTINAYACACTIAFACIMA
jgi:hypothetical protein